MDQQGLHRPHRQRGRRGQPRARLPKYFIFQIALGRTRHWVLHTLWWTLLKHQRPTLSSLNGMPRGSRIVLWVACSGRIFHRANKVTLHL